MLSADRLLLAIDGINMTFDEFAHKLNGYREAKHIRMGRKIVAAFAHQEMDFLKLLLETLEQDEHNRYARLNGIVIKSALHSLDPSYPLLDDDKVFITEYLYAIESWTWFELYLFCNTMPFFTDQDLLFLGQELLGKSEEFRNLLQNTLYIKNILLNLISEMIERKKLDYIPIFKKELEDILTPYDVFEQILLKFLVYVKDFIERNGKNKKEIENFIQSLELLNNEQLVALLRMKLTQYELTLRK
ncbi:transcriptional regulator [Streptococcus himalayensis]|uniref:Transcriptional regulator n=1 Tax=Streptococcus himalayensis TaxID=1888195 RepID=A0A917A3E8_9STRE|nr:transcriptional regulator [Streptococcus himalayensis]